MNTSITLRWRTRNNAGSAMIAMLAILGILFILFTVNSKTLLRLSHEVDAVNKQQTNHWAAFSAKPTTPGPKQ